MKRIYLNDNQASTIALRWPNASNKDIEYVDSAKEARRQLNKCEPKDVEEKNFLTQRFG